MNEFEIYKHLCDMSAVASLYEDGAEVCGRIRSTADRMTSKVYRVAVIGEFKRGKSSLINALVGSSILPTDILPMTAVITHLVYGEEKRIDIHFKDGRVQESTVDQLFEFATKYDEQRESMARSVEEIIVHYPSVYCKNHIEILDTPGMNDNEEMTRVTLSVLGNIDAAIMVVSANSPLSETEQNLVLQMIEQQGIHHVIFVVTHIDKVSDEESEQDRIIERIRQRITGNLLERATQRYSGQEELLSKANAILSDPDIYGVSSVLAMRGFTSDNRKMLKASRFPRLKQELLDLLTAAQSTDVLLNAMDYARIISAELPEWHQAEKDRLEQRREELLAERRKCRSFFNDGKSRLIESFIELDKELAKGCFLYSDTDIWVKEKTRRAKSDFISALAGIRKETDTDEKIYQALKNMWVFHSRSLMPKELPQYLQEMIEYCYRSYVEMLPDQTAADRMFKEWQESCIVPEIDTQEDAVLPRCPKSVEPICYIDDRLEPVFARYAKAMTSMLASFRRMMFQMQKEEADRYDISVIEREISQIDERYDQIERRYEQDLAQAKHIAEIMQAEKQA